MPIPTRLRFTLLLALAVASIPATAAAQTPPTPDAVAQARGHFTRGVKLYEEDDYRTALIEFNRAYELAPNWQVLYDIGQCHYQLRDYANALAALERYVAAGGASIASDRRSQVDREIEELRGRVAHVAIAANVEGADVAIDDAPLGRTPFAASIRIGAGRHRLTATKEGWIAATKIVDVAGGDDLTIRLDLTEAPREAPPAPPRVEPSDAPAWIAGGVGVAGIAVGSIFGVAALANRTTLKGECGADKVCPSAAQSDVDAFNRNGTIATIGFGVGLVGLAASAYLHFGARASVEREAAVRAWIAPGGAGLAGAF